MGTLLTVPIWFLNSASLPTGYIVVPLFWRYYLHGRFRLIWLWSIVRNLCFIHSHITQEKILFISSKQTTQKAFWIINMLLPKMSKRRIRLEHSFVKDKCSGKIVNTLPFIIYKVSVSGLLKRFCVLLLCFLEQLPILDSTSSVSLRVC